MKTSIKVFSILSAMIILFANIFRIVDVAYALKALDSIYSTGNYVETMSAIYVSDIVIVIILMLVCLLQVAITLRVNSKYALYYVSLLVLTLLFVEKIYIIIASNAIYDWTRQFLFGDILIFILIVIGVLSATASAIVRKMVYSDIPCSILALVSSICFTGVMLIYLVSLSSTESVAVRLYCVTLILGSIGLILRFAFNIKAAVVERESINEEDDLVVEEDEHVEDEVEPTEPKEEKEEPAKDNDDNILQALTRLKELYNRGLITSEEYIEKRQKYVDRL